MHFSPAIWVWKEGPPTFGGWENYFPDFPHSHRFTWQFFGPFICSVRLEGRNELRRRKRPGLQCHENAMAQHSFPWGKNVMVQRKWAEITRNMYVEICSRSKNKITFFEWSPKKTQLIFYLAYMLTLYLAFYLTCILTFYLAFFLAHILTFHLAFWLAFCLTYILTVYLAFFLAFYLT